MTAAALVLFAFVALCIGCAIADHLHPTPSVDDLLTGPPSDTAELDAWGAQ